ncbi:MAG: putative DNA-binding domain-containing protein [Pseudomonadota bacterium]|nr:putative DNA-binding domain-containing protein [Pseudomonadota bacterium]
MFDATISAFARALTDPAAPPPLALRGSDPRGFAVYRNNVAVGLIKALEARYPVVRRLVGDDYFRAAARAFIARNMPQSAVLIAYGAALPQFLRAFPPAAEMPYLPDVAALENAWVEAYHAAEAAPLTLAALAEIAPERLERLRFRFHPAARWLRLATPAASIWAAHQGEGEPEPPAHWRPEDALITRPDADVRVRVLPEGGYDLIAALQAGATLGEAAEPLLAAGCDPGAHLVGLIEAGALSALL